MHFDQLERHQHHFKHLVVAFVAAVAAACGGGGESDTAATTADGTPTARLTTPVAGKVSWNVDVALTAALISASGSPVAGPLACRSDDPLTLSVAADCSSIRGLRLGTASVTVTSGGAQAAARVKVIPPAQPLASREAALYEGPVNMVVTPDGRLLAWGSNETGLLGQGNGSGSGSGSAMLPSIALPTAVKSSSGDGPLTGIVAASVGSGLALALTEDGEVYSWGVNNGIALGRPFTGFLATLPGKVVGSDGRGTLGRIVAVSAGGSNAVALAEDGTVYSWGLSASPGDMSAAALPALVSGLTDGAVAVSAGASWSMALQRDGRVVSWGWNAARGAGLPADSTLGAPSFVLAADTGQALTGISAISAGGASGMALTSNGELKAWGTAVTGVVNGSNSAAAQPSAITVMSADGRTPVSGITQIAQADLHVAALNTSGQVLTWGLGNLGQLGSGPSNIELFPVPVVSTSGSGALSGIAAITVGQDQSLALTNDGRVLLWGSGARGGLGQGDAAGTANSRVPLAVKNESGTADLTLAPMSTWPNPRQRGNP